MVVRCFSKVALVAFVLFALIDLNPAAAQTPDWNQDQNVCRQLPNTDGPTLFVLYPWGFAASDAGVSGQLSDGRGFARVNGAPVNFQAEARFFFVVGGGATVRPGSEAVWSVRTETVEAPELSERIKAYYVTLWRPGIKTDCSPNEALATFGYLHSRHVSLYEYAQHHPIDPADNQSRSLTLQKRLHLKVGPPGCKLTDDPAVSGPDRWDAYGFEKIPDDDRLIRTIFRDPSSARALQSIGRGKEQRAAYTMEFTIARAETNAVPACFGFTVPIPVRDMLGFQVTHDNWRPYLTKVRFRRVPGGGNYAVNVSWKPR